MCSEPSHLTDAMSILMSFFLDFILKLAITFISVFVSFLTFKFRLHYFYILVLN